MPEQPCPCKEQQTGPDARLAMLVDFAKHAKPSQVLQGLGEVSLLISIAGMLPEGSTTRQAEHGLASLYRNAQDRLRVFQILRC
jgi:hypothetical protein